MRKSTFSVFYVFFGIGSLSPVTAGQPSGITSNASEDSSGAFLFQLI
jgi:hypothetical protein